MNKESQTFMQQIIELIADGKSIDWQQLEANDNDTATEKLKAIEQISQAFAQSFIHGQTEQKNKGINYLFKWAHLLVLEKIDEGSFGEVFRAHDSILNREVALKLRKADLASVAGSNAFMQEARRLARVRHPNVIAVHGAAIEDGQVGIWMDLLEGQNLKEYFNAQGPLDINTIHQLTSDIAQALDAVHQSGLIHGDVKPSNIFRQTNGVFVLMDFGAGSELLNAEFKPTVGTPLLMAPELFAGQAISTHSDQYSLGVMLYQLLCGSYPITGSSAIEIKASHIKHAIEPIKSKRPDTPHGLANLISALLSKEPLKRPTAKAVIAKNNWLLDAPIRRKRLTIIAVIIGSLLMGVLASSWGYLDAVKSERKALIANQQSTAVNTFLADIIQTSRPNVSGKNTEMNEVLDLAVKKLENTLIDQPLARAEILHHIGNSYLRITAHPAAAKTLKTAFDIRVAQLGTQHIDTLDTQGSYGNAVSRIGDFEKAKELLLIDDQIIDTLPLENHIRFNFWHNQSDYYSLIGEHNQAEIIRKKILSLTNKEEDEVFYYETLDALSRALLNQKKFTEAEVILHELLLWAKTNNDAGNLLLNTRNSLTSLLGQTKRFEEAEVYARQNLRDATDKLGSNDPFVISSMSLLSNVLHAQHKYQESSTINLEALNLAKETLGDSAWLTLRLMNNQGNRLNQLNQSKEAEAMFLETIKIAEAAYPSYVYSYLPRINLTETYFESMQFEKAVNMARQSIPFLIELKGASHRITLKLKFILAQSLHALGQDEEAKNQLMEILPTAEISLGQDHSLFKEMNELKQQIGRE